MGAITSICVIGIAYNAMRYFDTLEEIAIRNYQKGEQNENNYEEEQIRQEAEEEIGIDRVD